MCLTIREKTGAVWICSNGRMPVIMMLLKVVKNNMTKSKDPWYSPNTTTRKIYIARLLLKLYGAEKVITLDKQRHVSSMHKFGRKSVTSDGFKLELYPSRLAAAKYNSYQTYLTVQGWLVTLILEPYNGSVSSVTGGEQLSPTGHFWSCLEIAI